MKHLLTFAAAVAVAHTSTAAFFAEQVIEYIPGQGAGVYTTQAAALGAPIPNQGSAPFESVLSPFSPHYETSQIVSIGEGGRLTLQLSNFVLVDRNPGVFELGVWSNVGLVDLDPNFKDDVAITTNPATTFGFDSAIVEVSADNVTWYSLNGGAPIQFSLPGNYFTNAGPYGPVPATPQYADFGKPFTGSLSDFNGKDHPGVLAVLNGSAGGTWLNLDAIPIDQVGYVRFSGVVQNPGTSLTETLEIDAVAINTTLAGAPVPEPGAGFLALFGVGLIGALRRRSI